MPPAGGEAILFLRDSPLFLSCPRCERQGRRAAPSIFSPANCAVSLACHAIGSARGDAGGDIAARCPYPRLAISGVPAIGSGYGNPATHDAAACDSIVGQSANRLEPTEVPFLAGQNRLHFSQNWGSRHARLRAACYSRNDKKYRSSESQAARRADVAAAGAGACCRGQTISSQTTAHPGHAKTLSP